MIWDFVLYQNPCRDVKFYVSTSKFIPRFSNAGNPGYPSSWIVPLIAAAQKGVDDCEQGLGLKRFPSATVIHFMETALENLGQPTPAQRTLIKAGLQNIWINRIDYRAVQQQLFEIWQVRMMLLGRVIN